MNLLRNNLDYTLNVVWTKKWNICYIGLLTRHWTLQQQGLYVAIEPFLRYSLEGIKTHNNRFSYALRTLKTKLLNFLGLFVVKLHFTYSCEPSKKAFYHLNKAIFCKDMRYVLLSFSLLSYCLVAISKIYWLYVNAKFTTQKLVNFQIVSTTTK